MPSQFVVVVWNSDRKVAVLGTATGRAFGSEKAANHAANDYLKNHPTVGTLVAMIETGGEAYGVR